MRFVATSVAHQVDGDSPQAPLVGAMSRAAAFDPVPVVDIGIVVRTPEHLADTRGYARQGNVYHRG